MRALMDRARRTPEWQLDAIGLAACAALAAAWYFLGFTPLSQARAQRDALQLDVDQQREKAAYLVRLQRGHEKSRKKVQERIDQLNIHLGSPDMLLKRMADLTAAASRCGLKLDETKPGIATAHDRFTTVPIHMTGTGGFLQCTQFLHNLRSEFRDTGMVGLALSGEPAQAEKPAKFTLDLIWYAAKAAPPPKAASSEGRTSK